MITENSLEGISYAGFKALKLNTEDSRIYVNTFYAKEIYFMNW